MKKIIITNFLLMAFFGGCQESKNITMNMPDTKPPLFQVQIGLNPELKEEQVVFEKYIQTRMGTAVATKLYANGDVYKIYLGSNKSLKKDTVSWKKVGVISQNGLDKIQKISKNSVADYIEKGPYKIVSQAGANVNWYFYFDKPIFVKCQLRQWKRSPRFVRKMDKVIEQNLTYK